MLEFSLDGIKCPAVFSEVVLASVWRVRRVSHTVLMLRAYCTVSISVPCMLIFMRSAGTGWLLVRSIQVSAS